MQDKTELWVKDASDKRLLVEAWGKSFAKQLRECHPGQVALLLNFTVRQNDNQQSCTLTGEFGGDSERGSATILTPTAEEVMTVFRNVDITGGETISEPWVPDNPQMSADGPCFTSCLASVKHSSLAFGEDFARPVVHKSNLPSNVTAEIWLPQEIRVFVPGVWMTEVRDADMLYTPCSVCKKKLSADAVACTHGECQGSPSTEKTLLTSVTLADATGALRHVLCRTPEMLSFCDVSDVASLEKMLESEGHVSVPFRARCDVILGAQKATQYGSVTVANFELLRAMPKLLADWNTGLRPAPSYVFHGKEA